MRITSRHASTLIFWTEVITKTLKTLRNQKQNLNSWGKRYSRPRESITQGPKTLLKNPSQSEKPKRTNQKYVKAIKEVLYIICLF